MSIVDDFLKKMKMVSDDDYDDDYDDYDDYDDEDEEIAPPRKKATVKKTSSRKKPEPDFEIPDPDDDEPAEEPPVPARKEKRNTSSNVVGLRSSQRSQNPEVCMIMPKSFDDANTIADVLLSHKAVVLNLEGIDMAAAQRIIDFASGACYTVGGNLQRISKKIFIVVPQDMNLSGDFEELVGDMVDLNSVNMMR